MITVEFDSRVSGIPCRVMAEIKTPEIIKLHIMDSRGRPAPWLSAKLDHKQTDRLEEEALIEMEKEHEQI